MGVVKILGVFWSHSLHYFGGENIEWIVLLKFSNCVADFQQHNFGMQGRTQLSGWSCMWPMDYKYNPFVVVILFFFPKSTVYFWDTTFTLVHNTLKTIEYTVTIELLYCFLFLPENFKPKVYLICQCCICKGRLLEMPLFPCIVFT